MKIVITLLFIYISLSCIGQEKNEKTENRFKNNIMEDKLYIPEVDSLFEVLEKKEHYPYGETTDKYFLSIKEYTDIYQLNLYPHNSPFCIVKTYYKSGMIKKKGVFFNKGLFQKGNWYYFDQQGNLTETINYDEEYDFTFEDLYELLQNKKIGLTLGHTIGGYHTSIEKLKTEKKDPVWYIRWLKNPTLIGTMTIDGKTGEILKLEDMGYDNN